MQKQTGSRSSFRSEDIKRKRSIVVPDTRDIQSFTESGIKHAWDTEKESDPEENSLPPSENSRKIHSQINTMKSKEISITSHTILLQTLTCLKEETERSSIASKRLSDLLDTALVSLTTPSSRRQSIDSLPSIVDETSITEDSSTKTCCNVCNGCQMHMEKWRNYLPWVYAYNRVRNSALWSLLAGTNLLIGECDEIVNALILVNALVLTIPFAMIPDLNFSYWKELKAFVDACDKGDIRSFAEIYNILRSSMLAVIFTSIGCIIVACMYYMFRPRHDSTFQGWWCSGGRDAMCLLILGTGVSVINIFFLTSYIFHYYSLHPDSICDSNSDDAIFYSWLSLCIVFVYICCRLL